MRNYRLHASACRLLGCVFRVPGLKCGRCMPILAAQPSCLCRPATIRNTSTIMKLFSSRPKWPPFHLNTLVHAHGSEKKVCVLKVDIARCQGIPRGHRPRARTEAPRMGPGRSRVHPRRNSFGDASGSPRTHPEKTRLLEFGPYAIDQRQWRGEGKPETFNFLGFTHICVKKRSNGRFTVLRQTIRKRLQTKLKEAKTELQRRMHEPNPEVGKWCLGWGLPLSPTASASRSEALTRLYTRPARSPVNASTPPSRAAPHDSGSVWVATPCTV